MQAGQTHGQFKTELCVVWVCAGCCSLQALLGEFGADLWHGWAMCLLEATPLCLVYHALDAVLPHCVPNEGIKSVFASRVCYICIS